jgi:hypothetical protein
MKNQSHGRRTAQTHTGGKNAPGRNTNRIRPKAGSIGPNPDEVGARPANPPRPSPKGTGSGTGQDPRPEITPAWRSAIGWGPQLPPPTIADLLPPDVARKFHQIWLATGANVLCEVAEETLRGLEDNPRGYMTVVETLETDVMDKMHDLFRKWDGEKEGGAA